MNTCANHHTLPDGAAYCPVCGEPARETPQPETHDMVSTSTVAPTSAIRRLLKPPAIVAIGAGILVIALVVAMVLAGNGKSPSPKKSEPAAVPTEATANEICAMQLTAMVVDIVVHGDSGLHNELLVNGGQDPFFQQAIGMTSTVANDQYQVGTSTALQNLRIAAANACSSTLGDAVRPNFPQDGTYPGQGD